MHWLLAFVFAALAASAHASYSCVDFVASITVSSNSFQPAFPPFENHYQSVHLLNELVARNASSAASPFTGSVNITETFAISAQYCSPSSRQNASCDVQVLTHGVGFDKSYWNFGGQDSQYDYVKVATEAGYATLGYDRIGNGNSTFPNPYTIQQAQVELAVLTVLTEKLRTGTLNKQVPKPDGKVFHVGHSFGSVITNALAATAPHLSDGMVLTGYSNYADAAPEFLTVTLFHLARENQPARFGNLSAGWLTWGDEEANQFMNWAYPFFDTEVLAYSEATKNPIAIAELLTLGSLTTIASAFDKPVLIVSGDADAIFCGGDCYGILESAAVLFPVATPFETYVHPDTGHAINLHFNASGAYDVVQNFLDTEK